MQPGLCLQSGTMEKIKLIFASGKQGHKNLNLLNKVARPKGFEPLTLRFVG